MVLCAAAVGATVGEDDGGAAHPEQDVGEEHGPFFRQITEGGEDFRA